MPTGTVEIRHVFDGGWATDFGPTAEVSVQGGLVRIPFLLAAENVFFELNGGMRKIGGLAKVNSSAIGSGEEIRGIFDYWRLGTSGSPTQKRVVHAGTVIYKDDADGTFTSIKTGLVDNAVPNYATFNDLLVISSDTSTDVPFSWDQTTFQNLAGSPPNFSFACSHKDRLFAAGVDANPSTLYFCDVDDPEDWGTGDAGTIKVGDDDGDRITGLFSFANELIVFKGPNFGSIWALSGSSTTDYAIRPVVRGVGAVWQNLIFPLPQDVGFVWSDGTVRSLRTTDRQGNYEQGTLSLPINAWIRENVNHDRLNRCWAAYDPGRNLVAITLPVAASDTPNRVITMDVREPRRPKWADLSAISAWSVARVREPSSNDLHNLYYGGSDGFVRRSDQADRTIDGTDSINGRVQTPHFLYNTYSRKKTLRGILIGIRPRGDYNATFTWYRDNKASESKTFTQGGGDVLGSADANEFELDTSTLAGNRFAQRPIDLLGGEGRSFSYEVSNNGVSQDLECHTITALLEFHSEDMEPD